MRWDVFCRVIDNYGDIGVCWRLCRALAARSQSVRLWVDDASALAWMAPHPRAPVDVRPFDAAADAAVDPGDVVIEAFGCDPAPRYVERMAARRPPPVWINLEYLSAEGYVERSHGLASPQAGGPGRGLTKWFYYPGYTPATGGLLRAAAPTGDVQAWLVERGWAARPGERTVLVFCYAGAPLPDLARSLAAAPTQLLCAPGAARALAGAAQAWPHLRVQLLPHLPQEDFDRLLHCTDLNFVRGEDSCVQAQCAGLPFVWQAYPQSDDAHRAKLQALLDLFVAASALDRRQGELLAGLMHAWNGAGPWPERWPDGSAWAEACARWRARLLGQPELPVQLMRFASEKARMAGFASTDTTGTNRG